MPAQNNAAVTGLQREQMLKNAVKLFSNDESQLVGKMMSNKGRGIEKVSKRALKIPLIVANGGLGGMFNSDGGSLGPGGAPTTIAGYVSTVGLIFATESTAQARWATEGQERAIKSAAELDSENAADTFKQLIDQLLHTAGDGVLATITAVSGSTLTVDNANQLYDGNNYLIVSSDGNYTVRGGSAVSVSVIDPNNKNALLTAAAPAGTAVGDYVVVSGGTGVPGTSILGIYSSQVNNGNTGTFQTINRAQYPGRLQTPYVNGGGASINPAMVILAYALRRKALGNKTAADVDFVWHGSLAEEAQWEANSLNYTQIQRTQLGSKAQDLLTKEASSTIGGRDLTVSNHARQGRLDGLSMKYYGMSFTKEIGPYKSGNQSVFTRYGSDGTPMASNLEYMVAEMQVFNQNPQAGCFIGNLSVPTGF